MNRVICTRGSCLDAQAALFKDALRALDREALMKGGVNKCLLPSNLAGKPLSMGLQLAVGTSGILRR